MASTLNKVELIGRLGKDPEIKNLTNGGAVANFSVATSEVWKDRDGEKQEKTEWHNIVVWNEKTIEFVEKYLKKGDLVRIEGKIQTRKWKDQDDKDRYTTEIVIPKFAAMEALMKLSFDNDNADSGSRGGGGSSRSGSARGGDRNNDDRGGGSGGGGSSRSSSRTASRDDRGADDRGGGSGSGGGGGRSSGRDAPRDDRNADDRGAPRRAAAGGGRNNADMDDDIPF